MSIPLYGCMAHAGTIVQLDDETVVADLAAENGSGGTAYTAFKVSSPFDMGLDAGYSKFRRATQHVHADGDVTVVVSPYRDGTPTGQEITRTLATGDNPVVDAPLSSLATTHQVKVTLSSFDAAAELGKARQYVVPRRDKR